MAQRQPFREVQHFSTSSLPKRARFDAYMGVLESSMWKVSDWDNIPDFNVSLSTAALGPLTVVSNSISTHHSHRSKADVERSSERNFHLFVNVRSAWAFTHNGAHERLDVGDVVVFGEGEHETHAPSGFDGVILKCPESWMNTWVLDSNAITGRNLRRDSRWGKVLSPMLQQLTPRFVTESPVSPSMLMDQLGSVLALIAADSECHAMPGLMARIRKQIRERCADPLLEADDIAADLDLRVEDLHRTILGGKSTFAVELRRARGRRFPGGPVDAPWL